MTEAEPRLLTHLSLILRSRPVPEGASGRIVAMCPAPLAACLASHFPDSVVILLRRPRAQTTKLLPPNLEWLTCTLAGAHFLPGSVAAVVSSEASSLRNDDNLRIVTEWLAPGGLICLIDSMPGWRWWTWLHGVRRNFSAAALAAGLLEEPRTFGLRVFRYSRPSERSPESGHGFVSQ